MDNDFDLHEEQECLPDNAEADNAAKNSRKETRGRKNAVVWSEQKELALVTLVLKHKAYKKTDKKKEEKWAAVKQELFSACLFPGRSRVFCQQHRQEIRAHGIGHQQALFSYSRGR